MSENKYEQRVRQRAEEFAIENHKLWRDKPWSSFADKDKEASISGYMHLARLSVQREAGIARDAWEEGRMSWYKETGELEEGEEAFINLDAYLQSLGLVPEK